jgi:hypothetical protein
VVHGKADLFGLWETTHPMSSFEGLKEDSKIDLIEADIGEFVAAFHLKSD